MRQPANSWRDVRDEVLRRIRAREWSSGVIIPGEVELAREFDCARATVGRALNSLAEDGVLDRRRRAGTRVAETPVRRATFSISVIRTEVEAIGAIYRHTLLERTKTPAAESVAAWLGVSPQTPVIRLRTLHLADDRPYCYEDRWVNPAGVPGFDDFDPDRVSVNEWLVQNTHYSEGTMGFQAEAAGPVEAELLSIPTRTPIFVLDRITRVGDQPITAVRIAYMPGHRLSIAL